MGESVPIGLELVALVVSGILILALTMRAQTVHPIGGARAVARLWATTVVLIAAGGATAVVLAVPTRGLVTEGAHLQQFVSMFLILLCIWGVPSAVGVLIVVQIAPFFYVTDAWMPPAVATVCAMFTAPLAIRLMQWIFGIDPELVEIVSR